MVEFLIICLSIIFTINMILKHKLFISDFKLKIKIFGLDIQFKIKEKKRPS